MVTRGSHLQLESTTLALGNQATILPKISIKCITPTLQTLQC